MELWKVLDELANDMKDPRKHEPVIAHYLKGFSDNNSG